MDVPTLFQGDFSEKRKRDVKSHLILAMCFLYFIHFFVPVSFVGMFLFLLTVIVFFISLLKAKPAARYFSIGMFGFGLLLNFSSGKGFDGFIDGMTANLPLLTLILLVPLLSIPLKIGGYFESIHYFMERCLHDPRKIYGRVTLFLFCMGPILNLGSIRVLHEMLGNLKIKTIIIAKAYLSGFSTVPVWSPYFASVALVTYYLEIPILDYIKYSFPLAFIHFIVGNIIFRIWFGRQNEKLEKNNIKNHDEGQTKHHFNLYRLFIIIMILMGSIFILEFLTKWPMMFLVSLISIVFPLLYCMIKQKSDELKQLFQNFRRESIPTMSNETVLFLSAGMFSIALSGTVIAEEIQFFMNEVAKSSFFLFVLMIVMIILILTFIGLHPVVVVTALVTQIKPIEIGIAPSLLALICLIAWSMSAVMSPLNPLNLLVSGTLKESSLRIGLKWNGAYLFTIFLIGISYVLFLHSFI